MRNVFIQQSRKTRKYYTFEGNTAIVAQTIINSVDTSRVDPRPFIVALLHGYAERVRTLYALPETPDVPNGKGNSQL